MFVRIHEKNRLISNDQSEKRSSCVRSIRFENVRRSCFELLHLRELIDSLPTFAPLNMAAAPLFELALEVACQSAHQIICQDLNRAVCNIPDEKGNWLGALDQLSHLRLQLPERRSEDFLRFWFFGDDKIIKNPISFDKSSEFIAFHNDSDIYVPEPKDLLLDELADASASNDVENPDDGWVEAQDVGGDMNITPEFVHISNAVFNDTEVLFVRLAARLCSAGRELVDWVEYIESCGAN